MEATSACSAGSGWQQLLGSQPACDAALGMLRMLCTAEVCKRDDSMPLIMILQAAWEFGLDGELIIILSLTKLHNSQQSNVCLFSL